jgi:hypothetical protein
MKRCAMLNLPQSTEFNKRIPKQKFYENITVAPTLKRSFVEQIRLIYWRNKIAATTVNLAEGKSVTEIEVFEIRLAEPTLDEEVLRQIDREISYHILFVLEYEGKYQAWIGYKEAAGSGTNAFKVGQYYYTAWMPEENLPCKLEGLDLDAAYENYVRQIAGDKLQNTGGENLKDSVEREEARKKLQKQIAALQAKIRKEKQLNRQVEMNGQLKKLVKEWEKLN